MKSWWSETKGQPITWEISPPTQQNLKRSASTSVPFISGGMTKRLHQMRHIPWLLGWLGAAGAEDDGRRKIFAMPDNVFKYQKWNEMWRNDPTCAYILHFETWNPFVTLMWHCGGRMGGGWTGTLSNTKCTHIISTRQSFRSQRSMSCSVAGWRSPCIPSVWGEKCTALSWLTTTAAFRRLHGSNCEVEMVKAAEGRCFTSWTKPLCPTHFFIHCNPAFISFFSYVIVLSRRIKKSFLPFHQPRWKALHCPKNFNSAHFQLWHTALSQLEMGCVNLGPQLNCWDFLSDFL